MTNVRSNILQSYFLGPFDVVGPRHFAYSAKRHKSGPVPLKTPRKTGQEARLGTRGL